MSIVAIQIPCFDDDGNTCVNASNAECTGALTSWNIADSGTCLCSGNDDNSDGNISYDEVDIDTCQDDLEIHVPFTPMQHLLLMKLLCL